MFKDYTIDHIDGITRIKFLKRPTLRDARAVVDEIAANYPYAKRLWDFRAISFDFSMDDLKSIAEYGKRKFTEANRVAIIAPGDLAYGEMRAFEVYRAEEDHAEARVFRTEEEALEWLDR